MTLESTLLARADSTCELCGAGEALAVYAVPPEGDGTAAQSALLCETCSFQIDHPGNEDINHWRCLNDSMWSQEPAVQVLAWRMLTRLRAEGWPQDCWTCSISMTRRWPGPSPPGKGRARKTRSSTATVMVRYWKPVTVSP